MSIVDVQTRYLTHRGHQLRAHFAGGQWLVRRRDGQLWLPYAVVTCDSGMFAGWREIATRLP